MTDAVDAYVKETVNLIEDTLTHFDQENADGTLPEFCVELEANLASFMSAADLSRMFVTSLMCLHTATRST